MSASAVDPAGRLPRRRRLRGGLTAPCRVPGGKAFEFGECPDVVAMSGLLGWPLARMGANRAVARGVSLAVGCISTILGLAWGYPLVERLL